YSATVTALPLPAFIPITIRAVAVGGLVSFSSDYVWVSPFSQGTSQVAGVVNVVAQPSTGGNLVALAQVTSLSNDVTIMASVAPKRVLVQVSSSTDTGRMVVINLDNRTISLSDLSRLAVLFDGN